MERVAILGSGPSAIHDLPQRGYYTIAVGGGVAQGDWDAMYLADPKGHIYFPLWFENQEKKLITTQSFITRCPRYAKMPEFTIHEIPDFIEPLYSAIGATTWAIQSLEPKEIFLAGCDASFAYADHAKKGWNRFKENYRNQLNTNVKITRAPCRHANNPFPEGQAVEVACHG